MLRLLIVVCLLMLAGCSSEPPRSITWAELGSAEALDGKTVILEGYPGVLIPATVSHQGTVSLFLMDTAAGQTSAANQSVPFELPEGTSANQARQLPEGYTAKDVMITCDDGSKVTYTDRVRLEGELEMVYGAPSIIARKLSKVP